MTENTPRPNETPLESWKEIAAYLKRDVRTVKRWEKNEGLPVRRHQHQARSSVYAYRSELEAWLATRQPAAESPSLWFRRPISALAMTAALLLALVSVASGPLVNPPGAAAREKGAAGIAVRQVWDNGDATGAPSPDGRYLSFVNWVTGDLAVRDVQTGENRNLTDEGTWEGADRFAYYSTWSPDGQQLAYTWWNEDIYELRIVGVDGGRPRVLYRNEEVVWIRVHGWSQDGKQILALLRQKDRTNQIALVAVEEGSVQVVKTLDWRYPLIMSLSPDGRTIAYDLVPDKDANISAVRDIYLLASDGSHEAVLVRHPANDYGPVWTPDGRRVVFASDRTGSTGAWIIEVEDGKPKGPARLVNASMRRMFPMAFTRNGALYFGYANFENGGNIYVATLDPQTGEVVEPPQRAIQRFEGENTSPSWSPDGRYLAYLSRRGSSPFGAGSWTIRIRDLETGKEREVVAKLDRLRNRRFSPPQWSPDGKWLLVLGQDLKGRGGLFRVDVRSGEATLIVESREDRLGRHTWSRDGKAIFFIRGEMKEGEPRSSLVRYDLETGRETVLHREWIAGLSLSPSGSQLAFVKASDEKGRASLMLMPAEGGNPRELLSVPDEEIPYFVGLAWTPDERYLLYQVNANQAQWPQPRMLEVWRVPLEGGPPQRLAIEMEMLRDLTVHPDGKRISFTGGSPSHAEVWVLENFLPQPQVAQAE
ncbi:MAG: hypothetical protein V3U28_02930 [Candidatus Acidoferrales bacterium]